jgi:predicted NUDIX family NTP pyrophosphohydrolase
VKQKGGKVVKAWAVEGDVDPALLQSNTFEMEWPPRSGKTVAFPEVDRARWFTLPQAMTSLNESQAELIVQLQRHLVP